MIRRRSTGSTLPTLIALLVLATGLVGCGAGSADDTCPERALAFVGPLTGSDGGFVRAVRNGAELAVRRYNSAHSECPVGLIGFDTTGAGDTPEELVPAIVGDPQIIGVVGPTFSGDTEKMMPGFEAAGIAVVSGSATNPGLADNGWRSFHRLVATDSDVAPADVVFMTDRLKVKRVAVIDDEGLYGKGLADLATEGFNDRNVAVPVREAVDPDSVDYRTAVDSVVGADVDAVFFGGLSTPAARLVRQLRDAGFTGAFVGGDGLYQDAFIAAAGSAAIGAFASCPCVDATGGSPDRIAFALEYEKVYGSPPGAFSAEYYDSVDLFLRAIGDGAVDRSTVLNRIEGSDVSGLTKRLRFETNGNVRGGPIYIYRVSPVGTFIRVATVVDGELEGK